MVAWATDPFAITVLFKPTTRQVTAPLTGEHETLLAAAVAAAPAATATLAMSVAE
jgi:hypothetical protein